MRKRMVSLEFEMRAAERKLKTKKRKSKAKIQRNGIHLVIFFSYLHTRYLFLFADKMMSLLTERN